MKKSELLNKLKLKTLLVGDSGAGKTYCAVQCAKTIAQKGGKVLYLDVDDGAILELLNLPDEVLENIDHENITEYPQLKKILSTKANQYDLIIIDILYPHLKDWCRHYAKMAFLKQGYYYIGEKKVPIENPETFDLRGFMYSLPNNLEKEIFIILRKLKPHVICTAYPIEDTDKRNLVYGYFDIVLQIYNTAQGRIAKTIKVRANQQLENKLSKNYIEALIMRLGGTYDKEGK